MRRINRMDRCKKHTKKNKKKQKKSDKSNKKHTHANRANAQGGALPSSAPLVHEASPFSLFPFSLVHFPSFLPSFPFLLRGGSMCLLALSLFSLRCLRRGGVHDRAHHQQHAYAHCWSSQKQKHKYEETPLLNQPTRNHSRIAARLRGAVRSRANATSSNQKCSGSRVAATQSWPVWAFFNARGVEFKAIFLEILSFFWLQ